MGKRVGVMSMPAAGLTVPVYEGWSWPCFFFGPLWCLAKSLWLPAIAWVVVAVATASVGWFVGILIVPWFANQYHRQHLAERGYQYLPD